MKVLYNKLLIGFIASAIIVLAFFFNIFEKFELVTLDQRFRFRPRRPTEENIVLIEMAEDSIEAIGRWPWSREWHATLLTILKRAGAKLILFDVIFDEESGQSQDAVFEESIRSAGNVYLPFVFEFKQGKVKNIIWPLKRFLGVAKGYGHVNVIPDIDGILRRTPLVIEYKGEVYPQIAYKIACDYLGIDLGDIKIPVDSKNQMLINWAGRWQDTFKHYSYIDIIVSYREALRGERPRIDLAEFKDKICIIGLTATALHDIKPIPLEPAYPAVGANANIINNILRSDFIKRVSGWADILFIYLMGMLTCFIVSKARFIRGAVYTLIAVFGYILISFLVFSVLGRWMALVYPASAMVLAFLGVTLYNEVVLALEKKRFHELSIIDGLTQLFNIRHFKDVLEKEFAASSGKRKAWKLSLIMADIDHFKNFNDTYGHQVGDFVLRMVARMFKDGSRAQDVAARYGGEEFIMMLPGTDIEDAKKIAERIRKTVEDTPLRRANETYSVTVSLGVAMLEDEKTKEGLIKKVDEALYMAKQTGRNRVCFK